MAKKFMQAEAEREKHAGTKGATTRAAARAGESTLQWSEQHAHDKGGPGTQGAKDRERANMALRFIHASKNRSN